MLWRIGVAIKLINKVCPVKRSVMGKFLFSIFLFVVSQAKRFINKMIMKKITSYYLYSKSYSFEKLMLYIDETNKANK
jgi:hypothetical protein